METTKSRLQRLGIELPTLPSPSNNYVPGVQSRGWVYVSGQTPTVDGKLEYIGRCDAEVDVETARAAARLAALNVLSELEWVAGVDSVVRIVKLTGYVASSAGFTEQPAVVDGASELITDAFGERGRHARSAIGVAWLPANAPVEVELVAIVDEPE